MAVDPRFFLSAGPFSADAILRAVGGITQTDVGGRVFRGVASLELAEGHEVSFCETVRYVEALRATRAGAVLVPQSLASQVPAAATAIVCHAPTAAFSVIAGLFHPSPSASQEIHVHAVVASTATIGVGCTIGPYSVIGDKAEIGPGCTIGSHCIIGPGVVLAEGCKVHDHVFLSHAVCGRGVVLFPGARIGQEGFGFTSGSDGRFVTAPQLGIVELGDHVQVGANSCVDRGSLGNTVLGAGTRVDNLVQIGHNVRTGRGCVLVAQVGISGSTVLEDHVMAGGQAGFAGHLTIGRGARIAAQSGIMEDVPPGIEVLGSPARPIREAVRSLHVLRKLTHESRNVKKRPTE